MRVAALTGIQSVLSCHSLFVWFYLAQWVAVRQLVNSLIAHVLNLLLLSLLPTIFPSPTETGLLLVLA